MKHIFASIFFGLSLSLGSFANTDSELKLDFDTLVQDLGELYLKVFVGKKGCQDDESPFCPGIPFSPEDMKDLKDLHSAVETISKENGWKNFPGGYAINQPGFEEKWDIVGVIVYPHDSKSLAWRDLQKAKRFKKKHPEYFE